MNYTEAKATVTNFVQSEVAKMQQYAETRYGIKGFQVDVEVKFNTYKSCGGTHNGGIPFVQLGLQNIIFAVQNNGITDFPEYPSFAFDKVIGSLVNVHWTKVVSALIAHEIAHAIQFIGPMNAVDVLFASKSEVTRLDLRGHKKLWKNIYKDLRIQFVNSSTKIETPVFKSIVDVATKPVATKPVATKPVVTKPVIKTKTTTSKKEWTTKEYRENGGLVIEYIHIASGSIIIKMFCRCNKTVSVWDPKSNEWVDSGISTRGELRKKFVETFVY